MNIQPASSITSNLPSFLRRAVLLACAVCASATTGLAQVTYTHKLLIQPIQLKGPTGAANADSLDDLFLAEAQAVWDQAGIKLEWLPFTSYTHTNDSILDIGNTAAGGMPVNTFYLISSQAGASPNPNVVNMWFARDIFSGPSDSAGFTQGNAIVIDNQGVADRRVIAHELGHSLLDNQHTDPSIFGNFNLMLANSPVPSSLSDIQTGGFLRLTPAQISTALNSPFLTPIPEPEHVGLLLGVVGFGWVARRRIQRRS